MFKRLIRLIERTIYNYKLYKDFLKNRASGCSYHILDVLELEIKDLIKFGTNSPNVDAFYRKNVIKQMQKAETLLHYLNEEDFYIQDAEDKFNIQIRDAEKSVKNAMIDYIDNRQKKDWSALWYLLKGTKTLGTDIRNWSV